VRALLDDVRDGKAESRVAAISITSAREAAYDFSHPILSAGLQIMVRGKGQETDANPLMDCSGSCSQRPSCCGWALRCC